MGAKKIVIELILAFLCIAKGGQVMAQINEIELPRPKLKSNVSLEEAIFARRSKRSFTKKKVKLELLGQLLWAAQGITGGQDNFRFRSSPSAGALYPMEVYVVSSEGLYHYIPEKHMIEILDERDLRGSLSNAALRQGSIKEADINFVICAVYERVMRKYKQRGRRYAHIEAGHIGQNILLQAQALGLGTVPIGAFDDQELKKVLSLPEDHEPLYIIPTGYFK